MSIPHEDKLHAAALIIAVFIPLEGTGKQALISNCKVQLIHYERVERMRNSMDTIQSSNRNDVASSAEASAFCMEARASCHAVDAIEAPAQLAQRRCPLGQRRKALSERLADGVLNCRAGTTPERPVDATRARGRSSIAMTRTLSVTLLLAAVAASAVHALRGLDLTYFPRCYYSDGTLCPLSSIEIPEPKNSALVFPGGKTRCAFNDFMSDQAGLLTNGTFFFELMPKPSSKKLMIYWQGGGACLDDVTCNFAFQCASPTRTFATFPFPYEGGILNPDDPMNPFHDWNIVHIPYCTGDLHAGNRVAPATEDPILSLFNRPQCLGQNQTTNLRGLENSVATLKWARANFPDVEHIVLSGTSAGSLASQLLSSYVSDLWDVKASGKRLSIVADSYVGVLPANREAGKVLNYFGTCDADLKLPPSVASACKDETLTVKQFGTTVLSTHPHIEWLFINSKGDNTQRLFYELARVGPFGYPFSNMPTAEEFYELMVKILDSYKAVSTKVTTFFIPGTDHTLVLDNYWYDRLSVEGEKMGDVIRRFLRASNSPTSTPSPTTPTNPSQMPTTPPSNPSQQPTKPTSSPSQPPTKPTPSPSQQPTKPTSNPSQQPPASSSPPERPSC